MDDPPTGAERFPPDDRSMRRARVLTIALVVGLGVAGWFVGFSVPMELGVLGLVALAVLGTSLEVRETSRTWVEIGEGETTLSIDGLTWTVPNDDVLRVWWTRCNAPGADDKGCTGLELWIGERRHHRRLSLHLTTKQSRRAFRRATQAFTAASWTYDSGMGVLVPDAEWGPGEPVPDLRVRARWRAWWREYRDDPLARDPLAHRHRRQRTLPRARSGTGGRRRTGTTR